MNLRSKQEKILRDNQASTYNEWYLERGVIPVEVEDQIIINSLKLHEANSLIDFGCGTGRLLNKISTL